MNLFRSSSRIRFAGRRNIYNSIRIARTSAVVALLVSTSSSGFVHRNTQMHLRKSSTLSRIVCLKQRPSARFLSSNVDSFQEGMKQAYLQGETDGILRFATSVNASVLRVEDIVAASLDAGEGKSGNTASMLNAWIGSCCLRNDLQEAGDLAKRLVEAFEELGTQQGITPDTVTYCLACTALSRHSETSSTADYILDQARRNSKKLAGGKRRKTLAAARRKVTPLCVRNVEDELKQLCGEDFSVLEETDDFFVVNKPSGIPCFHKRTTTAGKIRKGKGKERSSAEDISLEDALINCNVPLSTLNPEALGLVHRLDRGASGCLILAKTDEMHAKLVSEFFLRRTEKRYSTIVSPAPDPSTPQTGTIEIPVNGRPARSRYIIKERLGESGALLEFEIFTGRKHQIRVHASEALSAPIYMDTLYSNVEGGTRVDKDGSKERFLLHASNLLIPEYGVHVEAPIPKWWHETIALLKAET